MKISLENLGLVLKDKRGGRGIREVAKEIHISPATLSRIELGKQPDLDTFTKIYIWLKVDPGDILGSARLAGVNTVQQVSNDPRVLVQYKAKQTIDPETAKKLTELIIQVQQSVQNSIVE
ncbi:MAG: helix-turn-helix transcriptional regulator [Candidatus Shapirobacteria bacterium]|jgi:transcriptional regulator with XRE-family HTH domain